MKVTFNENKEVVNQIKEEKDWLPKETKIEKQNRKAIRNCFPGNNPEKDA